MSDAETDLQNKLRLFAGQSGGHLWRNNSGALRDATGRLVRFGLGNDSAAASKRFKSSDLIGVTPLTIQPQHVGTVIAVFTAIEVKDPMWPGVRNEREQAQARYIDLVRRAGGIAGFATTLEGGINVIQGYKIDR